MRLSLRGSDRTRSVLLFAAVAAVFILATFLRQEGVAKRNTVWAEDGAQFSQCAWDKPFVTCLTTPYQGYLHTVPRLGAEMAVLGPAGGLPLRLTLIAALVGGLAAALAALAVAEATGSLLAGFITGASTGLVYPAGFEIAGNLTNAHWILLACSVVILVAAWLGRRPRPWDLALIALTAVTSALGALLAVIAVVPVIQRRPGARRTLAVATVCSVPQVLTLMTAARTPSPSPLTLDVVVGGFRQLVGQAWFGPGLTALNLLVPALLVAALALQAQGLLTGRHAARIVSDDQDADSASSTPDSRLEMAATLALAASGLAVWLASVVVNHAASTRYLYDPSVLAVAALSVAAAFLARRAGMDVRRAVVRPKPASVRALGLAVVAALLAVGFTITFRIHSRESAGPNVAQEIAAQAQACGSGANAITVDISPIHAGWKMTVPCRTVVASSGTGTNSTQPLPSAPSH